MSLAMNRTNVLLPVPLLPTIRTASRWFGSKMTLFFASFTSSHALLIVSLPDVTDESTDKLFRLAAKEICDENNFARVSSSCGFKFPIVCAKRRPKIMRIFAFTLWVSKTWSTKTRIAYVSSDRPAWWSLPFVNPTFSLFSVKYARTIWIENANRVTKETQWNDKVLTYEGTRQIKFLSSNVGILPKWLMCLCVLVNM